MQANRIGLIHFAQATFLLLLVGLIVTFYLDHENRQSIIRLAATDIQEAGRRIAKSYPPARKSCGIKNSTDDFDVLADALAAVEQLGTSSLERFFEAGLIRLAGVSRLPIPDFSLGPGQIRPSTAEDALKSAPNSDEDVVASLDRHLIALDLLNRCRNRELGILVLRMLAKSEGHNTEKLPRNIIMRLAGEYNSQVTAPTSEAALANYLYRELTYQVFQEFKFQLDTAD